jgi:DNA-binding transcriptional ArsR family regulator
MSQALHEGSAVNPLEGFQSLPEQKRASLIRITLELRKQKGDAYAKQWLTEHLTPTPPPTATAVHDACPFEEAFRFHATWCDAVIETNFSSIPTRAVELYRHFLHYATADMHLRGYHLNAIQHTFFTVGEAFCHVHDFSKATFYRHLNNLKEAGLVDYCGHRTTLSGRGSRCDGTIFAVKLHPDRETPARVTCDHLKTQDYRNLEQDIRDKRTFWQLRQSFNGDASDMSAPSQILKWIHSKCTNLQPHASTPRFLTVSLASTSGLEVVRGVNHGPKRQRGQRLANAVQATVRALNDHHSAPFWWKFYDGLATLAERDGKDYATHVHLALERERTAHQEGFARNASALFIARLKKQGLYTSIMASMN